MTVYIGPVSPIEPRHKRVGSLFHWPFTTHCYLYTDEPDSAEIDIIAANIGLKRKWKHDSCLWATHYDLTRSKHAAAIRAGAVSIPKKGWHNAIWRVSAMAARYGKTDPRTNAMRERVQRNTRRLIAEERNEPTCKKHPKKK